MGEDLLVTSIREVRAIFNIRKALGVGKLSNTLKSILQVFKNGYRITFFIKFIII